MVRAFPGRRQPCYPNGRLPLNPELRRYVILSAAKNLLLST